MSKIEDVQAEIKNTPGLGKRMAKYSAVGAVIAIPVPIVGPIFGALAGAAYAYSKRKG
jgi:hypothetical protein